MQVIDNFAPHSDVVALEVAKQQNKMLSGIPRGTIADGYRSFISNVTTPQRPQHEAETLKAMEKAMAPANAIAKAFRENPHKYLASPASLGDNLVKDGAIAKSVLDVGSLTNFSQITGGQSLGYVSLDTQMARGTVRPNSFTLYQSLKKTAANQIVDYWAYIDDTGGALPGAAFSSFGSVSSGILNTDVGDYTLQNIKLSLMLDGRAMTTALAAQNSFVDIATQESANAALTVLSTANWASYWGNPNFFPNQFVGLASSIPTANQFNFQTFYAARAAAEGWSNAQTLYNLIYETAADIASFGTFGRITHAFMSPIVNSSLQGLITTTLNNILNTLSPEQQRSPGIIVNGDLQGMRTRFGVIQFVIDLFINSRATPAQAYVLNNGSTKATATNPTPPVSVTLSVSGGVTGSAWTAAYSSGSTQTVSYVYAVASCDANMNESNLTYSAVETAIQAGGAVGLAIVPPGDTTAYAFRVYRSGLGYAKTGAANTPYSFRYIGTVLANGASTVNFLDLNTQIPGGETIFLLDMAEEDNALDFRYLLPLTKIELFAQNLYMPWAVSMIGAIRNRIPKFHALVQNFVPDNPEFNPLSPNN